MPYHDCVPRGIVADQGGVFGGLRGIPGEFGLGDGRVLLPQALARWVSWWVIGGIEIQQSTRLGLAVSIVCRELVG